MIIPPACFSCGRLCNHDYDEFLSLVKEFEMGIRKKPDENWTPMFAALAHLQIGRRCCRRMYITQQDMYMQIR